MRAGLVAARGPGLRLLAVIRLPGVVLLTVSDRDGGVRVVGFSEGVEGMQGISEVGHDPGGLAERRAMDGMVT